MRLAAVLDAPRLVLPSVPLPGGDPAEVRPFVSTLVGQLRLFDSGRCSDRIEHARCQQHHVSVVAAAGYTETGPTTQSRRDTLLGAVTSDLVIVWSSLLDLGILMKTALIVIRAHRAY